MSRTLTADHLARLQAGRKRVQDAREKDAIRRVLAFRDWLKAGSKLRQIPCVPTDADYEIARRRGAIR